MTNYTSYPLKIDGYATLPLVKDNISEIVAADHNRLRSAIIAVQQELGVNPSGTFATVAARLNTVGDAAAAMAAHISQTIGAHTASAIALADAADNYVANNVEDAIAELASVLPVGLNTIGEDKSGVPNSALPCFVSGDGKLFAYNQALLGMNKFRTEYVTGLHIIEVGESNGSGVALLHSPTPGIVHWSAPDDSPGAGVDVSSLSEGEVATIYSNDTTKAIRVVRTAAALPTTNVMDTFNLLRLDAGEGAYSSSADAEIISSNYITRTAISPTGPSLEQFVISGFIYPADKGTLVLQKKPRGYADFFPIAILDLEAEFDESLRAQAQAPYVPTFTGYDTITLFDRQPARNNYELYGIDADGDPIHENFDIRAVFSASQVAKYTIPCSNTNILLGELESPDNIGDTNLKVASYRIVHYREGVVNFNGDPAEENIFSVYDPFGSSDSGDNTVRISNVYMDTEQVRSELSGQYLIPWSDTESAPRKYLSGINYYYSNADEFMFEAVTDDKAFSNSYRESSILTFNSESISFPDGNAADITSLIDIITSTLFSDTNLPGFSSVGVYITRPASPAGIAFAVPAENAFSVEASVTVNLYDPFGISDTEVAYGKKTTARDRKILINSYPPTRAGDTLEYFTDESYRIGTLETFGFRPDGDQFTGAGAYGTLDNWDSNAALAFGELQCGGIQQDGYSDVGGLVFPQDEYSDSLVFPEQHNDGHLDYSNPGYQIDSIYQRLFNLGYPVKNARLKICSGGPDTFGFWDIAQSNTDRFGKIEVKIPGPTGTGWLDITVPLEEGCYADDDGCLFGSVSGQTGDFTVPISFGPNSNTYANGMLAVRVTYFGAKFGTARYKILTMLELLPY